MFRYVCGYSMKQEEIPAEETQDCGIWTVKDVDNLAGGSLLMMKSWTVL